jgi:hypothetical protein
MSALVRLADISRTSCHVRLVPQADICSAAKLLFDHLVGAGKNGRWNVEAETLRGLEVDHELVLGWAPAPVGQPASRP